MWQPINVYILWLGKNFTASQKNLVKNFVRSISPPKGESVRSRVRVLRPSLTPLRTPHFHHRLRHCAPVGSAICGIGECVSIKHSGVDLAFKSVTA